MKKLRLLIIFTLTSLFASGQTLIQLPQQKDSLKVVLKNTADPLKQFDVYRNLARYYTFTGIPDSVPHYTSALFRMASKQKNDSLLMVSYQTMALYLDFKTDTKPEVEYLLKALKIAENKYPSALSQIYFGLACAYLDIPDYEACLKYLRKSERSNINKGNHILHESYSQAFLALGQTDSALYHIQKLNAYFLKSSNKTRISSAYMETGRVYEQLGEDKLARFYFEQSVTAEPEQKMTYIGSITFNAFSRFLFKKGEISKAKHYGLAALTAAKISHSKRPYLESVQTMREIYAKEQKKDSAYYFANLELAYRDSLFSQQKLNAIQDITFNEQLRQTEEALKKTEEAVQHRHNLQYSAIAVGLITFVILLFLFSRTILVSEKFIEFFGVLGLLAVFEFINLYIHPYLGDLTHHSPVFMLCILIVVAAMLVPLHHKIEKWMTKIMVEKNKKIRLAAAKRTIVRLETTPVE